MKFEPADCCRWPANLSIYWLLPGPAVSVLPGDGANTVVLGLWFVASGSDCMEHDLSATTEQQIVDNSQIADPMGTHPWPTAK